MQVKSACDSIVCYCQCDHGGGSVRLVNVTVGVILVIDDVTLAMVN